jgi:ribosomal protein S18 acetylase RimI-like enzyme
MSAAQGVVRLMRADEAEAVGQLTLDAYVNDGVLAADDDYAEQLANAGHRGATAEVWVYEEAGELIGTVTFCPPGTEYREVAGPGEGEFRMLGVAPPARGRGVAAALVDQCFRRCRELGLTGLVLCTLPLMTSAVGLYGRFGFERDESLDWSPEPGLTLIAFRAPIR